MRPTKRWKTKTQSDMKNSITKIKSTLEEINSRPEVAEEWNSELEMGGMQSNHTEQEKENRMINKRN